MKKTLLIQKIDMDTVESGAFEILNNTTKETLPENVQEVTIPHSWSIKKVDDNTLFVQMDENTNLEHSSKMLNGIREKLGEEYTVLYNICEIETIDMYRSM